MTKDGVLHKHTATVVELQSAETTAAREDMDLCN